MNRKIARSSLPLTLSRLVCSVMLAGASFYASANPHFKHIPADTPLFMGSTSPHDANQWRDTYNNIHGDDVHAWLLDLAREQPLKRALPESNDESSGSAIDNATDKATDDAIDDAMEAQSDSQESAPTRIEDTPTVEEIENESTLTLADDPKFMAFADWLADYIDDPAQTIRSLGIDPGAVNLSVYMVGPALSFRLSLAEPERFIAAIDDLEAMYELEPLAQSLAGTDVRVYDFAKDPRSSGGSSALAVIDGDAIFSISFQGHDQDHFAALGLAPVTKSLADTGTVAELQDKYAFGDQGIGYISSAGALLTARQLNPDLFSHAACDSELASITNIWPRVVYGYRDFEPRDGGFYGRAHGILEINHPGITGALKKIRGLIPDNLLEADSMLTYAIGIDVSRLGQAAGEIALLMSGFNYQCPALAELNKIPVDKLQQGVIGINMMSGFAQGVRGFALSLFDFELTMAEKEEGGKKELESANVDAIISVQARNPAMLLQMAKAIPQLAEFNVPADGTPIDIGTMIAEETKSEVPIELNVAQRANRIVGYTGEQSSILAQYSQEKDAPDNGLFFVSMNVRRYMDMLTYFMREAISERDMMSAKDKESFEKFSTAIKWIPDGRISYMADFTDRGFEVNYTFDLHSIGKQSTD